MLTGSCCYVSDIICVPSIGLKLHYVSLYHKDFNKSFTLSCFCFLCQNAFLYCPKWAVRTCYVKFLHESVTAKCTVQFDICTDPNAGPRPEKRSEERTLPVWWCWTVKTWCPTLSQWTAGSAMGSCSLGRGCCSESACTAFANLACALWSCWARSRRCPVPTETTRTLAHVPCRSAKLKLWCPLRSMSAGCREASLWQSLVVRAVITVPPPTVRAGVFTKTLSMCSTVLSAGNTTASSVRLFMRAWTVSNTRMILQLGRLMTLLQEEQLIC